MLNHWEGVGRLKAKPELQTTGSGTPVCTFVLAVQRDVSRQAEQDTVDWITCVAWGKDAENITTYYDKGDPILICGRLQTRNWEDIKKQTRSVTEVKVEKWYRLPRQRDKNPDVVADDTPGTTPSRPTSNRTARFVEVEDDGDLPF